MQRLVVRYHGRVQGVGFRATTEMLSRDYSVVGRVRNMSDGSVELVAEGDEQELLRFSEAIAHKMGRFIQNQDTSWEEEVNASGYSDFRVAPSELR